MKLLGGRPSNQAVLCTREGNEGYNHVAQTNIMWWREIVDNYHTLMKRLLLGKGTSTCREIEQLTQVEAQAINSIIESSIHSKFHCQCWSHGQGQLLICWLIRDIIKWSLASLAMSWCPMFLEWGMSNIMIVRQISIDASVRLVAYLCLVVLFISPIHASAGDRLPEFQECRQVGLSKFSKYDY